MGTWLRVTIAILASLVSAAPGASQEPVPVGEEFEVNTYTLGNQAFAEVASDPAGNFVVVWASPAASQANGVKAQRYDASGHRLGGEFKVNTSMVLTPYQTQPDIAAGASASFVVTWTGRQAGSTDIFGQRLDASGNFIGSEFRVNTYTTYLQRETRVAAASDGTFVVVWESNLQDGSKYGVFGQRFDGSANPVGAEFRINTYTTGWQDRPAVATDPAGAFVVAWESNSSVPAMTQDGDGLGVFAQRFDRSGMPLGQEFQVNTYTTDHQFEPGIAVHDDGSFVIAWTGRNGVFAQRYDIDGSLLGGEFLVAASRRTPTLVSEGDGSFVVAYESSNRIFGQRFDANGNPVGEEFQVNTYTIGFRGRASIAAADDGRFVVAWHGDHDGNYYEIVAQRYAGPGLYLAADGTCPGTVTASLVNAPPNSEVAIVAAANTNGFVKGGNLCPGTELEIGEPFGLPPSFIIVDSEGRGSTQIELEPDRCWLEALALASCETSLAVQAPQ